MNNIERSLFAENVRFLREYKKLNQAEMLAACGFKQPTWNGYEKGASFPSFKDLIRISDFFEILESDLIHKKISEADLIDLRKAYKNRQNAYLNADANAYLNPEKLQQKHLQKGILNEPETPYKPVSNTLIVTVDQHGTDNIIFVPIKAQAGYLVGYGDPEFIETLPSFQLPGMRHGTFRMFEVQGVSMSPTLSNTDRVIGEYITNMSDIRENRIHIVVQRDGIKVKRVINRIKEDGKIYLKSDTLHHRSDYPITPVDPEDILEIWYVRMRLTSDLREPSEVYTRLTELELAMQKVTEKLGIPTRKNP